MLRRVICIVSAVSLLLGTAAGKIGYIIFSNNYNVSTNYNSYSLNFCTVSQTIYDRNKKKLNNNKNTLVAVIKPNEKCLSELDLLFDKKRSSINKKRT